MKPSLRTPLFTLLPAVLFVAGCSATATIAQPIDGMQAADPQPSAPDATAVVVPVDEPSSDTQPQTTAVAGKDDVRAQTPSSWKSSLTLNLGTSILATPRRSRRSRG